MARAWADIDLAAIRANVRSLADVAGGADVCSVVKAGGYGHGAVQVARAALEAGATWLAVAQVPEAVELRAAGIDAPILLLAEPRTDELAAAVDTDLRITVYSQALLEALAAVARARGRHARVHLKVDTGMHRVGARPDSAVALASSVARDPALELEGVWTHCAVADEPDDPFTARQLERFEAVLSDLAAAGIEAPVRHAANSAAAIAHPASRYDLVRCGIAMYGIPPSPALEGRLPLLPALRLATEVSHVQAVSAGEGISYGLRYRPERDTVVATLPIGYADGVFRALPAHGQQVLLAAARAPMAGVVTMDQLMVDCGPDAGVSVGDEAVLLGAQGSHRISPQEWAQRLGTIGYEVVCALGERVERRYLDTGIDS